VRQGTGGRRREVGMDEWGWGQLRPWLTARLELPVGPLFCIIDGPTRGRPWSGAAVRREFRRLAVRAGVRAASRRTSCATRTRARRAAEHHPAPARPRQPRHDLDLPPRHRPRGDHRDRPHAPSADNVRQRRPAALGVASAGASRRSGCAMAERASGRDDRDEWSSSVAGVGDLPSDTLATARPKREHRRDQIFPLTSQQRQPDTRPAERSLAAHDRALSSSPWPKPPGRHCSRTGRACRREPAKRARPGYRVPHRSCSSP
jgi:hypothetical protein